MNDCSLQIRDFFYQLVQLPSRQGLTTTAEGSLIGKTGTRLSPYEILTPGKCSVSIFSRVFRTSNPEEEIVET